MTQSVLSPRAVGATAVTAVLLAVAGAVHYNSIVLLFFPAAVLFAWILGARVLINPAVVLSLFLFLIVNLDFFKIADTGLSLDILLSSVLLYALVVRLVLEKRTVLFSSAIEKAYLVFLGAGFISVLVSVSPGSSIKNWFRFFEYLALYAFVLGMPLRNHGRRKIVAAILLASIAPAIVGIVGIVLDIPALYGLETPLGGGETIKRVSSTLSHPVSLSLFLGLVGVLNFGLILDGTWFRRTYLVPLFFLQLAVLYLTFGRTGWILFVVGILTLLWISGRRRILFAGTPLVLFALFKLVPTFQARWETALSTGGENSLLWRVGLWAYTITLVPQRPIFGSGLDTFTEYVAYDTGKGSHQTWIGLLIETGIVGVLAFVILMVVVGRTLWRRSGPWGRFPVDPLRRATFAIWCGVMVASLTENPFYLPLISVYFWPMIALSLREDGALEANEELAEKMEPAG